MAFPGVKSEMGVCLGAYAENDKSILLYVPGKRLKEFPRMNVQTLKVNFPPIRRQWTYNQCMTRCYKSNTKVLLLVTLSCWARMGFSTSARFSMTWMTLICSLRLLHVHLPLRHPLLRTLSRNIGLKKGGLLLPQAVHPLRCQQCHRFLLTMASPGCPISFTAASLFQSVPTITQQWLKHCVIGIGGLFLRTKKWIW